MRIKEVLRSRRFQLNLLLIAGLTFAIFWLGFKFLDVYTRHGTTYVVPDFSGMTPEAIVISKDLKGLKVVVFDSIYDNSRKGGIVIDQDPSPGTEVKRNRTVHLTIVSKQQEMVSLPDLGNTERSARSQLEAYGLQIGRITEVPGEYTGLLMGASFNGRPVFEGERLPKGSRVDIEVSTGKQTHDTIFDESFDNDEIERF